MPYAPDFEAWAIFAKVADREWFSDAVQEPRASEDDRFKGGSLAERTHTDDRAAPHQVPLIIEHQS